MQAAQTVRTTSVIPFSKSDLNTSIYRALNAHNACRIVHGVQNFTLNATLSQSAQAYANYLAGTERLRHSRSSAYGENIFFACKYLIMNDLTCK